MADLCARFALPPPTFHPVICGFEVDFAWWLGHVIAECDGWESHGRDPRGFARDRERDPVLIENGWVVVRFTWEQIICRPVWTAERLRGVLASRSVSSRLAGRIHP
jgi:very-short-patch-repair endonuclease